MNAQRMETDRPARFADRPAPDRGADGAALHPGACDPSIIEIEAFDFFYGPVQVLHGVTSTFPSAMSPPSSGPRAAARPRSSAASTG
jgi:hypothetical protein